MLRVRGRRCTVPRSILQRRQTLLFRLRIARPHPVVEGLRLACCAPNGAGLVDGTWEGIRTFRLGLGLWRSSCALDVALGIGGARAVAVDQDGHGEQGGKQEYAYDEAGGLGCGPLVCHVNLVCCVTQGTGMRELLTGMM